MNHWINDIEITNFKSIRHQKIEGCKKINVFVGPPNVGKSNLLEAMALLSYLNVIDHSTQSLHEKIRFDNVSELFFNYNLHIKLNSNNNIDFKIGYIDDDFLDYELNLDNINFKHNVVNLNDFGIHNKVFTPSISESVKRSLQNSNVKYYKFDFVNKNNINKKSLILNQPNGNNLGSIIFENEAMTKIAKELVNDEYKSLKFYNGSELKIEVKGKDYKTDKLLPFSSIADTLQRLLFHQAAIISNKNAVILLEEPEAHCYEPYIMDITNAIKQDENNNQFFIVTHSQYVISELLREHADREQVNIYLVGLENGETNVKLLGQEDVGQIYRTDLNVFFNYTNLWDRN